MMPIPFLITGLPRSRTAWMAVAASNELSVCIHEPLRYVERWQHVFETVWGMSGFRYVGASDHGLGFHLPEIFRRLTPRTLIIERPIAEVEASLARIGIPGSNFCDLLMEALNGFDHPLIMRVPYADLADTEVVGRCLAHLMPFNPVSAARIEALQKMNIQAPNLNAVVAEGIRRGQQGDAAALVGEDVVARIRLH